MKRILLPILFLYQALGAQAQWTPVTPPFGTVDPNFGVRAMSVIGPNSVWVAGRGATSATPNNNWARTTNGGQTWITGTTSTTSGGYISSISGISADTAWVTMTSPGRLLQTTDGGNTWTNPIPSAFTLPGGFPNFVHFFNHQTGIVVGDPVGTNQVWEIYTTSNGGQTWTQVPEQAIPARISGETGTVNRYFSKGNNLWFITKKGRIYHSHDLGLTFSVSTTGLPSLHHAYFHDQQNGFSNVGNQVESTSDGGNSWATATISGPMHYTWYEGIPGTNAMISTGLNSNSNDVGSSYSLDQGQTWTAIESQIPGTMVRFYDNANGYLSSTSGGAQSFFKWGGPAFALITATEAKLEENKVKIWPNPSSGNIRLLFPKYTGNAQVMIKDITGRMVYNHNINCATKDVHLEISNELTQGLYFMQILAGAETTLVKIIRE